MKPSKDEILRRCLELPCIGRDYGGGVTVNFKSRLQYSDEAFRDDPIQTLRHATQELMLKVREACLEKLKVLDEIEQGTNRYRIEGGNFSEVGKERPRMGTIASFCEDPMALSVKGPREEHGA